LLEGLADEVPNGQHDPEVGTGRERPEPGVVGADLGVLLGEQGGEGARRGPVMFTCGAPGGVYFDEESAGRGEIAGEGVEIAADGGFEVAAPWPGRVEVRRDGGRDDRGGLVVGGEQALLLVGELLVEARARDAGPADEIADGDARVAALGHQLGHR